MNKHELAAKTQDAYSVNRYNSWPACVALLQKRGYNDREVEAILRSKHMRWASDQRTYGRATSGDLARYLDDPRQQFTQAEVDNLVRGTF